MNQIIFRVEPSEHAPELGEVTVLIDGLPLREHVRQVELTQPEVGELAGKYAGLRADQDILPPSKHSLGVPRSAVYDYGGKTQVLGCECGEPGCWPLVCLIEVSDSDVTWRSFEQPHRSASQDLAVVWSYEALGPFRFRRTDYEAALASLATPDAA